MSIRDPGDELSRGPIVMDEMSGGPVVSGPTDVVSEKERVSTAKKNF